MLIGASCLPAHVQGGDTGRRRYATISLHFLENFDLTAAVTCVSIHTVSVDGRRSARVFAWGDLSDIDYRSEGGEP